MKKLLKISLKIVLAIFSILILYVLCVLVLPLFSVHKNPAITENNVEIYILTNGVHTDIVCPVKSEQIDWSNLIPFSDTKGQQEAKYIAFGWGDKGFYLDTPEWKDLKVSTALKAAFWLGNSAMHVTFYNKMHIDNDCRKININVSDYENLIQYIKASFRYDEKGKVELIATEMVYGTNDAFYEATGTYNVFFTCNTWANNALKAAHQTAPVWTATQQGIFRYYNTK